MIVYQIKNKKNGKKYIGQHVGFDLQKYWSHNVYLAEHGYQGKRLLYRAIRKYGRDAFEVKTLVVTDTKEETDFCEVSLISLFESTNPDKGYNITAGGGGSLGVKMSDETRAKMSKSRLGRPMPEKSRIVLAQINKGNKYSLGKKMTKENFEKLMAVHIGAKRSDEAKRRMSESHKGHKHSEETKQRMRDAQQRRREREKHNVSNNT